MAFGTHIHLRVLSRGALNNDLAGKRGDRKITYGYSFHLGTNMISWASQKQPIESMFSAEAEYVAATIATCHAAWLRRPLKDMGHTLKDPTSIFCDNNSAIQLSKHNVFHRKNKHIDTRYHLIHELVNDGQISLVFGGSKEQFADMCTKPLRTSAFLYQREHLGIDSACHIPQFCKIM